MSQIPGVRSSKKCVEKCILGGFQIADPRGDELQKVCLKVHLLSPQIADSRGGELKKVLASKPSSTQKHRYQRGLVPKPKAK